MVSFWPDSIWTPEFTDLATVSPSPHRHLDAMAVAGAAAVLTQERADRHQRRRHRAPPSRDAGADGADDRPPCPRAASSSASARARRRTPCPTASISRSRSAASRRRSRSSSCCGRARARSISKASSISSSTRAWTPSSTTASCPPIWIGASGPRMLEITGRHADGWWPAGAWTPEDYAAKLQGHPRLRRRERAATRWRSCRPSRQICLIGDEAEIAEMLRGAAGQVDPPDAHRRGSAHASATSTRWARPGAAIRTSIRAC